jgi:hypothetical protein
VHIVGVHQAQLVSGIIYCGGYFVASLSLQSIGPQVPPIIEYVSPSLSVQPSEAAEAGAADKTSKINSAKTVKTRDNILTFFIFM